MLKRRRFLSIAASCASPVASACSSAAFSAPLSQAATPSPSTAAEAIALPGVVEDDFEFIELKNIGASPLDVTGVHFGNGILFDFTGSEHSTLAPGASRPIIAIVLPQRLVSGLSGTGKKRSKRHFDIWHYATC